MYIILSIILILLALLLIGVVLIQPGKGDMISGMSGIGGQFNQMLGASKATSFLAQFTWGVAISIILLSLLVNFFVVGSGNDSGVKAPTEMLSAPATIPTQAAPAAPIQAPESNDQQQDQSEEN